MLLSEFIKNSEPILQSIFKLFPPKLQKINTKPDHLDRKKILYEFGDKITTNNQKPISFFGGEGSPELEYLFRSVYLANIYLKKNEFSNWLKQIEDTKRHLDFLFEMRPFLNIKRKDIKSYEYEFKNNDKCPIDWAFDIGKNKILLEVKNRPGAVAKFLEDVSKPPSTAEQIFNNIEKKFKKQAIDSDFLQGVWIHSAIREDKKKLDLEFEKLNHKKIHFAIFCGWENDAYILTREKWQRKILLDFFNLNYSENFVSSEINSE